MSGALDSGARKIASKNIKKYGKSIIYTVVGQKLTNPETGERTGADDIAIPTFGFAQTYSTQEVGGGNGNILAGDKHVLIAAMDLVSGGREYEPKKGDHILMNSVLWTVQGNKPVEGQINIMHDVQVRIN